MLEQTLVLSEAHFTMPCTPEAWPGAAAAVLPNAFLHQMEEAVTCFLSAWAARGCHSWGLSQWPAVYAFSVG